MPRILIPDIPENILLELSTLESAQEWKKRLEAIAERLEEELREIKSVLKYVVIPKYNELNMETLNAKRNLQQPLLPKEE